MNLLRHSGYAVNLGADVNHNLQQANAEVMFFNEMGKLLEF